MVVTVFDRDRIADYQRMVAALRNAGIRAELYLGNPASSAPQIKYADKRSAPCVVIQGGDEKAKGEVQIKDLILGAEIAELDQGPRRISEEAGRGAVRGARGRAGRSRARGAGAPRYQVGLDWMGCGSRRDRPHAADAMASLIGPSCCGSSPILFRNPYSGGLSYNPHGSAGKHSIRECQFDI